jgi:hypothetical protein
MSFHHPLLAIDTFAILLTSLVARQAVCLKRCALYCAGIVLVQACAVGGGSTGSKASVDVKREPIAGFFIPKGAFDPKSDLVKSIAAHPKFASTENAVDFVSEVILYASPTTEAYLESGGLNTSNSQLQWEIFLKKYKIPFTVATSVSQLEKSRSGVLLLPSSVALSKRERQAIIDFRGRGGSILATWLCGVRDEKGAWTGFSFMENALDVKVVGDTTSDKDDNFLMPHGDSPVTNFLPAGRRVWLERVRQWYPLRFSGRFASAHMMDWSRTFTAEKTTATMNFDERKFGGAASSRSVAIGYSERLWLTADPQHLEALAHNALIWALRLPSAYLAAWPAPFSSGLLLAIDAGEIPVASDMALAKQLGEIGAKATFYSLSDNAQKSSKNLSTLQAQGHELAYLGDKFIGFRDQPIAEQANRLDRMRLRMKEAGINVSETAGFHAPTESYDKNTEALLVQRQFDHYIAFMESSEARLPFLVSAENTLLSKNRGTTVVMPRTQRGPEDATEEGDVDEGLKSFLDELALAEKMAGLSVVRIPTQGLLTIEQLGIVVEELKARSARTWMASASEIAHWWRERSRVKVQLIGQANLAQLMVEVMGDDPIKEPVSVWVNLPSLEHRLNITKAQIESPGNTESPDNGQVKLVSVDQWRTGVVLSNLNPGKHVWQIRFDRTLPIKN